MKRVYNFASGPSMLPIEVLNKVKSELLDYNGTGMSVMELPKESPELDELVTTCEKTLRKLLEIPNNYKVLFLQGGSTMQYSAVPLNLLSDRKCADYIITGPRSRNAYFEAKKYGDIVVAASSGGAGPVYNTIPETAKNSFRPDADYVYMCYTNPACGTKFHYVPDTGNIPLVADMTGFLLSEPVNVSKFGLIFASAQTNFGIAGLTIVIVRDDLLRRVDPSTPSLLNYKLLVDNSSRLNTPPVFSIYMTKLMLDWIVSIGGLEELKRRNERKASRLYDYIDGSQYYTTPVDSHCRSIMNIKFFTGESEIDEKFIAEAEEAGFINLRGESNTGCMLASLYNSMPYEGVDELVKFMEKFAIANPKINF